MKITRRQLRRLLTEALNPSEASYFGPVFAEVIADYENPANQDIFNDYQSLMIHNRKYPNLQMLGSGAFRITYENTDDPRFLLKVAKPGKKSAIQDNETEINVFNQFPDVFPKVYYAAPDKRFFIIERVQVLNRSEFGKALQQHFPDMFQKIESLPSLSQGFNPYESLGDDKIENMWRDFVVSIEGHRIIPDFDDLASSDDPKLRKGAAALLKFQLGYQRAKFAFSIQEICEVIKGSSFKKMFDTLTALGVAFRELRSDNMGVTPEGRLVIIDNSQLDKAGPAVNIDCASPVRGIDKNMAIYMNPDSVPFDKDTKAVRKKDRESQVSKINAVPDNIQLTPAQQGAGTQKYMGNQYNMYVNQQDVDPEKDIPTELSDTEFDIDEFVARMKKMNAEESGGTNKMRKRNPLGDESTLKEFFDRFMKKCL